MKVYPGSNRVSGSWALILLIDSSVPVECRKLKRGARSLPESEWACLDIKWMHKRVSPTTGYLLSLYKSDSTHTIPKDFAGSISIYFFFSLLSFSAYNRNVETLAWGIEICCRVMYAEPQDWITSCVLTVEKRLVRVNQDKKVSTPALARYYYPPALFDSIHITNVLDCTSYSFPLYTFFFKSLPSNRFP